jgi:hypothetical protein
MKYNAEDYTYDVIEYIKDYDFVEDFLKRAADKLPGTWKVRTAHRDPLFFGLNVKGKGFGDYDKFNKDNRWEKMGVGIDEYYDVIYDEIGIYFREWERWFSDNFGLNLDAQGRSGGYWGFTIEDLTNFDYVLELNKDVIQSALDRLEKDGIDLDEEYFVSDTIINSMTEEELDDLIRFNPKMLKALTQFTNCLFEASDYRETDEYSDDLYELSMDNYIQ